MDDSRNQVCCPLCGSSRIQAGRKGYGVGKAAAGALLLGPLGLLGGFIGSSKVKVTCLKCGHVFAPGDRPEPQKPPRETPPPSETPAVERSPAPAAKPVAKKPAATPKKNGRKARLDGNVFRCAECKRILMAKDATCLHCGTEHA